MKLENQVTSLELSQKLKELGVKQESYFYWVFRDTGYHPSSPSHGKEWYLTVGSDEDRDFVSAFTVAELGEGLPDDYKSSRYNGKYYADRYEDNCDLLEGSDTEANARAKLRIYLIESSLLIKKI